MNFGTNATFTLPVSTLQFDFTAYSQDFCAIAVQTLDKMPFDITTERHFYFGNIFFQQFVGIFDQEYKTIGMAQSTKASTGVTLECPG